MRVVNALIIVLALVGGISLLSKVTPGVQTDYIDSWAIEDLV